MNDESGLSAALNVVPTTEPKSTVLIDVTGLDAVRLGIIMRWRDEATERAKAPRLPVAKPITGLDAAIANADPAWMDRALDAVRAEAATGNVFEGFDLTQRHDLVDPDHSARWGALFKLAMREGIVRRVGYGPSSRPTRHRGVTGMYRGAL